MFSELVETTEFNRPNSEFQGAKWLENATRIFLLCSNVQKSLRRLLKSLISLFAPSSVKPNCKCTLKISVAHLTFDTSKSECHDAT
jgi:hypothetical protein